MSFPATGLEVTSRGGNFGGLKVSLMFWMRERYHGSSTPATSSRDRWSSAFGKTGLLGCDRSAILIHQLSGRAAVYSLLDARADHAVTAFEIPVPWNSANSVAYSPDESLVKTTRYSTDSFHNPGDSRIPNLEFLA